MSKTDWVAIGLVIILTAPVWITVLGIMISHDCSKDGQCPICDKEF